MFLSFELTTGKPASLLFKIQAKPITASRTSFINGVIDILAQADADQPVAWHVGVVPISVEGHAFVTRIGGRCTKVRRVCITTPMVTVLVTISVTRNEESRVERSVADQQFVSYNRYSWLPHLPAIRRCQQSLPIVSCGRYRLNGFSFKNRSCFQFCDQ